MLFVFFLFFVVYERVTSALMTFNIFVVMLQM